MVPEARQRHGEPSSTLCAMDDELSMMHDFRSRQLPTNHCHASLHALRATREYQFDSPSRYALPLGPGLSRDGPEKVVNNN